MKTPIKAMVLAGTLVAGSLGFASACHTNEAFTLCAEHKQSEESLYISRPFTDYAYCVYLRYSDNKCRSLTVRWDNHMLTHGNCGGV